MRHQYSAEIIARFRTRSAMFLTDAGCEEWLHGFDTDGYGLFTAPPIARAHRFAWAIASGDIPTSRDVVGHTCDNPRCVFAEGEGTYTVGERTFRRFGHLFLTDSRGNTEDSTLKGRRMAGERHTSRTRPETRPRGSKHALAKLTEDDVRFIRAAPTGYGTGTRLARQFGVSKSTISDVRRRHWKHVT